MGDRQIKWLLVAALALTPAAVAAPPAPAEGNPYYEACKTFGGEYEERRVGCDPDCVITYICEFEDGSGRMCGEEGNCAPLGDDISASSDESAAASDDDSAASSGQYADRGECLQAERSACQDQCSGKSRTEMASCLGACLDDACGDYESSSSGDSSSSSDEESDEGSVEDCKSQCDEKCSKARGPMKRKCQEQCEKACEG